MCCNYETEASLAARLLAAATQSTAEPTWVHVGAASVALGIPVRSSCLYSARTLLQRYVLSDLPSMLLILLSKRQDKLSVEPGLNRCLNTYLHWTDLCLACSKPAIEAFVF